MPLIYVDYPERESLKMIYGTFNKAILEKVPFLQSHAEAMTDAMVDFHILAKREFTTD